MAFESVVVPEDWGSAVVISLYKVGEIGLNIRII